MAMDYDKMVESMCLTMRHDFGLDLPVARSPQHFFIRSGMTDSERDALLSQMRQLVEHHFKPALEAQLSAARAAALNECAKIADSELSNTSSLMSMPPQSSAAWNIANRIRALATQPAAPTQAATSEQEKAFADAITYGTGAMLGDKHVPYADLLGGDAHPPHRRCGCKDCAPSFEGEAAQGGGVQAVADDRARILSWWNEYKNHHFVTTDDEALAHKLFDPAHPAPSAAPAQLTREMIQAGMPFFRDKTNPATKALEVYRAMAAAAPAQVAQGEPVAPSQLQQANKCESCDCPEVAKAGCHHRADGWRVLTVGTIFNAKRKLDVVLTNGVTLEQQNYFAIDWTQVRDWRYTPSTTEGGDA